MRRLVALLVTLAALTVPALLANTPLEEVRRLPESNPYRGALERYTALSAEDRERLDAWVSSSDENAAPVVLDEAERALVRELYTAVVAAAKAPPLTERDWPIIPDPDAPDNLFAARIPPVGPMRALSRLSVKAADELPADEALEIYSAVAQFGRNQRAGDPLIQHLTGIAIEGIALAGPTRRLAEFTPEQLRRLSEDWNGLHPRPSHEKSVSGERERFFRPFVEKILRPGLHALAAGNAGEAEADASSFTRDLRLSGLMDLGEGERIISLENVATRSHFTLKTGQTAEGIELVSMDISKRQAVIRRGKHEAVIDLEAKRIVERRLSSAQIREYLRGLSMFSDKDQEGIESRWLKRINEHPGGIDGYLDELVQEYDRQLGRQLDLASTAKVPAEDTVSSGDPLIDITMPTIGKVARALESSAVQTSMLQAAIHHRLAQLGAHTGAAKPADPWAADGSGFSLQPAKDGVGFVMTSRYEIRPDQPVTYKFAAPDAGFIRVTKP